MFQAVSWLRKCQADRARSQRCRDRLAAATEGKNFAELVPRFDPVHSAQRPLPRCGELGQDRQSAITGDWKANLSAEAGERMAAH